MAPSTATLTRDVLPLIDAGCAALERHDRPAAAGAYARASEILFRQASTTSDVNRKADLAHRAQQLLRTAQQLRSARDGNERDDRPTESRTGDWKPLAASGVTFADVSGLEHVKQTLQLRIIYPLKHPETLARYGLRGGGGLLLFGPPGTGKTLIAKAVAGELELPFFAIKPSEVLSKWFGESEQKLAGLFDEARQQPQGAVIFVDEIDAIGTSRESSGNDASRRLLTQLLQELDGVRGRARNLLFLAATNVPWLLDDALLRPGRFDERCYVPLPDKAARQELLRLQLAGCQLAPSIDLTALAGSTDGYSGADLVCFCERAKQIPFREAVLTGCDRPLRTEDFHEARRHVRPSVSAELLQRYDDYVNQ